MGTRGKRKPGWKKNGEGQFVAIPHPMAGSAAFRSLRGSSLKVWVELRSRFNGMNNGDLSVSLDEASRLLGIGKATAQRGFAELEAKGFIKITKRGSWYGRMATTWSVTDRSLKGERPTNDWKNWRPPKPKK